MNFKHLKLFRFFFRHKFGAENRSIPISTGSCKKNDEVFNQNTSDKCAPESVCEFPQLMDINCKTAIITGGETGIGFAAADDLLSNGAKLVVLAGVCDGEGPVKELLEKHGDGRACFMHMDVNDPRDFEELFYRVDMVYGGVDIVFNNAGILQDQLWEYQIDTNLKSVMRGTILGLDYMGKDGKGKKRGRGLIINHSDVIALDSFPFVPCYVATKLGIIGATRSFGSYYHFKNSGVRVVGLMSGPTKTDLLQNATEKQLTPEWGKQLIPALTAQHPPQRPATVGRAVTYMVKYAPTGSLWTVENGELFHTNIPSRYSYSKKITQL